jgi:hypothetical protein
MNADSWHCSELAGRVLGIVFSVTLAVFLLLGLLFLERGPSPARPLGRNVSHSRPIQPLDVATTKGNPDRHCKPRTNPTLRNCRPPSGN